jgi:transposase-like protein
MEHRIEVRQMFDESFKRKVIEEYLTTGCSKMSLLKKYDIHFKSAIQTWMQKLGYTNTLISGSTFGKINKFQLKEKKPLLPLTENCSKDELIKRIKDLERRLEDEQLLREIYEKMIKAAEDQFKINIRKKSNTK